MSLGDFIQGTLTGFVLGGGLTWWACHRGLKMALERVTVDLPTVKPEPGYREPAQVSGPEGLVSLPVRVLCKDCRHLGTGRNAGDCLAAPVPSLLGPINQITGEYRTQSYKLAVMVNENFNCKNWKAK